MSPEDSRHLANLQRKQQVLRDLVAGVVRRRHTGLFLGGRGGIGKSHVVESELRRLNEPFKLWNSTMTARSLFEHFAAFPESVHVMEDVESVMRDQRAVGVLRSALWGTRQGRDGRMERQITWNAKGSSEDTIFTGGVIITSNRRLADLPELDALKTRISWLNWDVSDPEIVALMRNIAANGWPEKKVELRAEQCQEVIEFLVEEATRTNRRLDLRLMVNSFEDRIQHEDFDAGCDWRDLVASRIRGRPTVVSEIQPVGVRDRKKAEQLAIAREITGMNPSERLRVWQERTRGLSQATLYRRLSELGNQDALQIEN